MTSASEWNAIYEACEGAKGPDRVIDVRIATALQARSTLPYSRSIDAITEAIARGLTECNWACNGWSRCGPPRAEIDWPGLRSSVVSYARTPALAICAAFCRAMAVKAESEAKKEAAE